MTEKTETYQTTGDDLVKKIKELIHQGNIRKITILDKNGREVLVVPVTIGVVGAAIAPALAAIGAIAVFLTECSVRVEKEE